MVRGYLGSAGFKILDQQEGYLIADKLVFAQDRDTCVVWTVPTDQDNSRYESTLRGQISRVRPNYPYAKAYVIAKSRGGFSRDFQQELSDQRIHFLVPIWFFDTAFKVDESPKAASAISDIRSQAVQEKRIPQPYKEKFEDGSLSRGDDLFDTLVEEILNSKESTVRVVVGRAGIGKSFLFRALFSHLYEKFLNKKSHHEFGKRPIPLVPEHLKEIYALRTELLIDNFLRVDVASPVSRDTFEWLLINGFTTWLLDGLDELYAGDLKFFDYISDLVSRKDSKAQIIIFCRDSLLTTSDSFHDFEEVLSGLNTHKKYYLSEWNRPSKRLFTWTQLEGKIPQIDEKDTSQVSNFLGEIDRSKSLSTLSDLPFYCDLLLKLFKDGKLREFDNDVDLLNHVVDQMIDRESKKGLIDLRMLEDHGIEEWLESIATDYLEDGRYADIDREKVMEYGKLILRENVDDEIKRHILTSLLQFGIFCAGLQTGKVSFTHDLIAEVLAARSYLKLLLRNPDAVAQRLSNIDLEDPTILRFLAIRLDRKAESAVVESLQKGTLEDKGFAVLLSLMMLARPDRDLIKKIKPNMEARCLKNINFNNRDLSDVSFRCADLSHAVFQECNLSSTMFEGAFLNRTRFLGENQLQDAKFGDLSRIQSVLVDKKLLDDFEGIRKWTAEVTGKPEFPGKPCPTATRIRFLFGKFITPLGQPRRDDLYRNSLLSGKRYNGAATVEECLDVLASNEYLIGPDYKDRFRRASGDKYEELVNLVKSDSISEGLGRVIRELCRERNCMHRIKF